MSLESLLRAARAGQLEVWPRLAEVLSERLYAYFRRMTTDDEAQDLAQSTFIRILERLPTLESQVSLEGWVFGVARNLWRERDRAETRYTKRLDDIVALADVPRTDLSSAARWAQLVLLLNEEIGRLPYRMRVAVENELAEGKTRALAERHGVAASTVREWRRQGIERVQGRILKRTKTPAATVSKLTAAPTPAPS